VAPAGGIVWPDGRDTSECGRLRGAAMQTFFDFRATLKQTKFAGSNLLESA